MFSKEVSNLVTPDDVNSLDLHSLNSLANVT